MVSGSERFEREISDRHAFHFFNGVARLEKTSAQGIVARFGKRHLIPGSVFPLQADDVRAGRARQAFDFFEGEQCFQFQIVGLLQMAGSQHQVCEIAVVGQENQAHGVIFEAADWKNALGDSVKQIAESATPFRVAHGGNYLRGLIQEKINSLLFGTQEPAVYLDVIARFVSFGAHLGDGVSIDGNHP